MLVITIHFDEWVELNISDFSSIGSFTLNFEAALLIKLFFIISLRFNGFFFLFLIEKYTKKKLRLYLQ